MSIFSNKYFENSDGRLFSDGREKSATSRNVFSLAIDVNLDNKCLWRCFGNLWTTSRMCLIAAVSAKRRRVHLRVKWIKSSTWVRTRSRAFDFSGRDFVLTIKTKNYCQKLSKKLIVVKNWQKKSSHKKIIDVENWQKKSSHKHFFVQKKIIVKKFFLSNK